MIPHSEEIEKSVLSALLTSDIIDEIYDIISVDSFYITKHQLIFGAIKDLYIEGKPNDLLSVTERLRLKKELQKAGDVMYITELSSIFFNEGIIENHCAILKQLQLQRYLITFSHQQVNLIKQKEDVEKNIELFVEAQEIIDNILSFGSIVKSLNQNVDNAIERAYKRVEIYKSGESIGITTGLVDLNKKLNWMPQDLIIIAARPGMGKTAFCLKHAKEAARKGNHVRIYSLEMGDAALTDRILMSESDIDIDKFKFGKLESNELKELEKSAARLQNFNIWIDDKPARTVSSITADSRKWKKKNQCDLIIIDYLQLAESELQYGSTNDKVSHTTRGLKKLAKELDIPIIVLSQLSRKVEERGNKIPGLSDLRDSGAIEQDADKVLFIYRPAYYGMEYDENNESLIGVGFYIVAKHREGATGNVKFRHNESLTKIYDFDAQGYENYYEIDNEQPF